MRSPLLFVVMLAGSALATLASEALPLAREIDRLISAKAGGPLAPRSDDAEFLRRISLDLAGRIPTAEEVRAFLSDKSPGKRAALIDALLASDSFAEHWTDRLSVMLLERQDLGKIPEADWRRYVAGTLRGEPQWNRMVQEMIAASGEGESRPAMKFLGEGRHERLTEDIARLFLGRDLECARCHDHPAVDDWKQAHYWGLFAYLNQTKAATHNGDKLVYFAEGLATKKVEFQSVFTDELESTGPKLPGRPEADLPEFEKGQEFERPAADGLPAVPRFRPRERLAVDLTSKENHLFVRTSVNRFWFIMMGRGLSHPLDQTHGDNPPSHPELLDLLAKEFASHDFNLKWLLRQIALSESYQRSSRLPGGVDTVEPASYRTALLKSLSPEQLLHAILRATGNEDHVHEQKGSPGAEKFDRRGYFSGTNQELPTNYDDIRTIFVETFGEAPGTAEDEFSPGLNKALFLMNDKLVQHWLEPHHGNLVERLMGMSSVEAIAEELYLAVLARFPDDAEREEVASYLGAHEAGSQQAISDLAWALLSSTEFRLNH